MHTRTRRSPRRLAVLLAVFALVTSACGARLTDEQRAAVLAGDSGRSAETGPVASGPIDDDSTSTTQAPSGDASGPGGGTADSGDGGPDPADGSDGSGGGDGGDTATQAGSACSGGGDSDVGVTADEIRIGNVSTLSGPVPGFGQTGINAVKAYFAFKNSSGGVCGRELKLITADDRLDVGVNRSETEKLSSSVLGFIGNTTVVDDGGASVINAKKVPDASLAIGDQRIKSPYNFSPSPIDLGCNCNGTVPMFNWFKANEGVTTAALVGPNQANARARGQAYKTDLKNASIELVFEAEVPVAETNYSGVANGIKDSGADLVITTLEINGMARLAKALHQAEYQPAAPFYGAQVYGRQFLKLAGEAANGTKVGLAYSIFEDAGQVPAVNDFVTWYGRVNPGADMDFFAIMGWVAADMFITALEQTSEPPSRAAIVEQLKTFTDFDAGGFVAPINPAQKQGAKCFMIAGVQSGSWKRIHPSKGFQC